MQKVMRPARLTSDRPGFTLVELLTVIVVLGIMVNIALPMFGSLDSNRLTSAAGLLEADLAACQVESMSHSEDLRVFVVAAAGAGYRIAPASDTDTPITNPATRTPYAVTFGQGPAKQMTGVTISTYSLGGDNQLKFGLYGQLDQAANATITLAKSGHSITLTIDPTTGQTTIGPLN